MANFRIDSFILELQDDGTFNLSGECNSDAGNPPTPLAGAYLPAIKEIQFDTEGSPNEKYSFFCSGINFNGYGTAEMAKVFFGAMGDALRKKQTGQMKDKECTYPPPAPAGSVINDPGATGHEQFSSLFTLSKINAIRNLANNNCDVSLELICPAGLKTYTLVAAEFLVDPVYAPMKIIAIDLATTNSPSPEVRLTCPVSASGGINLANFNPDGLAIIVKEDTRPFSEVTHKKALFFIR